MTPKEKRGRVVDHAKRLYSIVVALAVAEACKRLFPFESWNSTTFVLFCTFLITIIPVFQGFDRSLDIQYYEEPLGETPKARFLYLWYVMMLLITSIFFFGMAQSIEINSIPAPATFYYIMSLMLFFDCAVLVIDRFKTHIPTRLNHYWTWIVINLILGVICFYASSAVPHPDGPATGLEWFVLLAAIVRSAVDYAVSIGFMFPHTEDTRPA